MDNLIDTLHCGSIFLIVLGTTLLTKVVYDITRDTKTAKNIVKQMRKEQDERIS